MEVKSNVLKYKPLGIYTQNENVVYMREDCHVCISEGFEALTRIRVSNAKTSIVASLNVINSEILQHNEIGLSDAAAKKLKVAENDTIYVSHLEPIESLSHVRAKIYNNKTDKRHLACLSYHSDDEVIVKHNIFLKLNETLKMSFGVQNRDVISVGDRHFQPGKSIFTEIINCITESCLVICVVSQSFCASD